MSIFPEEIEKAAEEMGGEWVKASEFEKGIILQVMGAEPVQANQFGASDKDKIVERNILQVGQTLRYSFKDKDGTERKHDSTSLPLFIGFKQAALEPNDWVGIKRTGEKADTRYVVKKLDGPEPKKADYPKEDINPEDIPF